MMNKGKRFFTGHAKSSALVASLVLHGLLLVLALSFVAVQVVIKKDTTFEAKPTSRPQLKLKKLTVPVSIKKNTKPPKLRKNIVAKKQIKTMDLKMPEITGVMGGIGSQGGGGLSVGFNWEMPDLFGSNQRGNGNEFVGYFYDLKQTKDGEDSKIGELIAKAQTTDWETDPDLLEASRLYREVLERFLSGWEPNRLKNYFKAPREKFTKSFMIPLIDASEAPKAFGVEKQVKPSKWVAFYRGRIAAPESGKYRFVGRGDDVLVVRVKKKTVLDASFMNASGWEGHDPDNRKYAVYGSDNSDLGGALIGDWFYLEKGKSASMDVLIGEDPGGMFFSQLYIQQDGVTYPTRRESYFNKETNASETRSRPVLPIFKTADLPDEVVQKMEVNENWASVEGPNFGVAQ